MVARIVSVDIVVTTITTGTSLTASTTTVSVAALRKNKRRRFQITQRSTLSESSVLRQGDLRSTLNNLLSAGHGDVPFMSFLDSFSTSSMKSYMVNLT